MDKQDIIRFAGYLSALYDVLTPIFYLLLLLLMLCFFLPVMWGGCENSMISI